MHENERVQQVVVAAPLLPGQREAYVRFVQEMLGQRREAYEASRRELDVTRERFWLLETEGQSVAVTILTVARATPIEALYAPLAGRRPFSRWLQRQLLELHGLDLRDDGKRQKPTWLPELIAEWSTSASHDGRQEMLAHSKKGGTHNETESDSPRRPL